jgi:FtsP/CotA-like multicopper oxidase with cupredoxin domain
MFANFVTETISMKRLLPLGLTALLASVAQAAAPGISGNPVTGSTSTFNLTAQPARLTQPDGQTIYSWGYGCVDKSSPVFKPATTTAPFCSTMQVPGPTLIVTEGDTVTVTLTNNLPPAAGNTSILFPGFNVCVGTLTGASAASAGTCAPSATPSPVGLLTSEAAPGGSVTYSFYAASPGTRAYYSGTQSDLQVEMGLYGAIIVLPKTQVSGANCTDALDLVGNNAKAKAYWGESDFRLATSAYDHPATCYDREYLFQFSEIDPSIHIAADAQITAKATRLSVPTEPYHPAYFLINGRSMPDDMDPNYAPMYPNQPYNGNPHMHPGEITLLRIIGQGRWQHPFHEHANHVRILGRDGNLLLTKPDSNNNTQLAGPLMFTTTTTPGLAMDGLFYYTGKGLNWDLYGHNPKSSAPSAKLPCTPDANGYNSSAYTAINYFEWCQDHNKPMQAAPFGDVAAGGPVTLPDPNIFLNGAWYGGSPYLGPDATSRATFSSTTCAPVTTTAADGTTTTTVNCAGGTTGTTPPSGTIANNPSTEAGFAFMWHSHNEREITTNNIFPGGMLMMMLVDSREFVIDESL